MINLKTTLILTGLGILIACNQNPIADSTSPVRDSESLLSLLVNPPAEYRMAPLWDWNDKITKEEIEFQMKKFKEGGLGGVFVHPRPGLVTEYLSDDWHQLFDFTVRTAEKLGMKVWIYDENSYPSGFAGGHVQARYPDSYSHGTGLGCKITADLADTAGLEIVHIQTKPSASGDVPPMHYIFHVTHPSKSWWYGGFPYVDLLYPGVTDTFMKVTMEGYTRYNKNDFGKTLPGIFTDEPNLEAAKGPGTLIRWTPDLFEQFEKRFGYDLKPQLIGLIEETGDWMKVRHDYYTLMLELFLDRWAVPWFDYCEKNNLDWTGHYWEHGWPYPGDGIDEAAFYMYHQVPGVDMLGRSYDDKGMDQQFGNTRAIRELGSAANQAGWNRRLSETWGGAGWQITFAELKRLVDWEVVLGVNLVNPHLSYYSMQGVRKFDYPPSFSYQEPWWDQFSLLGDYVGRICLAMSAGEQINHTLILQPNTTAWMYHSATKNHPAIYQLSKSFKAFVQTLEEKQFEYDLGSEQVLRRFAKVSDGGLEIRTRTYDHLVIPPGMRNIESATLKLLDQYLAAGKTILCFSDSVDFVDGQPGDGFKKLAAQYPFMWINGSDPNAENIRNYLSDTDFKLSQPEPATGQIFHQRRTLEDGQLLFVVNSDLSNPANAQIEMPGKEVVELNLVTGLSEVVAFTKQARKVSFSSVIPPGGSKLFLVMNQSSAKSGKNDTQNTTSELILESVGPMSVERLDDNILTIDFLDLETRKTKLRDTYFMNAMYTLFKESELPTGNPWQHKIQYKQQYLDLDTFGPETRFTVTYRFTVGEGFSSEDLAAIKAVVERPHLWKVFVNNQEVTPLAGEWWLDRHFPVFAIGSFLKTGENQIRLKAERMSVFAEIMPIYLLGNFSLESSAKGFNLKPTANPGNHSWAHAGLPFYPGPVGYTLSYNIPEPKGQFEVVLGPWQGAAAEVFVNGSKAGVIGWEPYRLDVTNWIKSGINSVEVKIIGSLKSTLGYHHMEQTGWIDGPWSWNQSPDNQPSGSAYKFPEAGLYKDFLLVNKRAAD